MFVSSDSSNNTQIRHVRAATDTPAQLMELGEAEAFGVLDQHHGRVRNVDADLDHGGRDEDIGPPRSEVLHHPVLVLRSHAPVEQLDPQIGEDLRREPLGFGLRRADLRAVALIDRGADHEGLSSGADLAPDEVVGVGAFRVGARRRRPDRLPALRHLVEHHDVEVPVIRERERPRDRGRGHDQHVDLAVPLALEGHPLMEAEPMLLVHDRERQVVEGDRLPARARACR